MSSIPSPLPVDNACLQVHGVFLVMFNQGILLTGASGVGKSELALGLISRGHQLVADDIVELNLHKAQTVIGRCPSLLQDFLEVRGLGILNVRALFGPQAIATSHTLDLVINIVSLSTSELNQIDRLYGCSAEKVFFATTFKEINIPIVVGRNMSILVEVAVRNHLLKQQGYDSGVDFMKQHKRQINDDS